MILKKLVNGKCIRNKSLKNEIKFKKQQTHQGNMRGGITFVTNRTQRNRVRSSLLTEIRCVVVGVKLYLRSQWQSQNGQRHSTAGLATLINMGAGQTREAKEIAMCVMVIRIMIIMKKATCML